MNDQLPDIRERSWLLQSMMEMQKTQGQLVEAVHSLRETQKDTQVQVSALAQQVGIIGHQVGIQGQQIAVQGQQIAAQGQQIAAQGQQIGVQGQQIGTLGQHIETHGKEIETQGQRIGALAQKVGALEQRIHAAQTVVWVVGMGLAGTFGLVGWLITNAIAVLPSVLKPQ